jgi:RNA polymerase sigma-70 factor (ECF subfamily)
MKPNETLAADLEALFRQCAQDLSAYFARRHGGSGPVDDLVQESFLQLARRLRAGQAMASPRAYLFGIARHISLAFLRQRERVPEPLQAASETTAAAEPDDRLEAARETIASLPSLQREILDLRFAHGLSYVEMATALNIPVGTVRSRLHHAVELLRQRLEGDNPDDGPNNRSLKSKHVSRHEN